MFLIRGKTISELSLAEFLELVRDYSRLAVDIGTGDGTFVYHAARENPATFFIGVDPVAENLKEISQKALKKPEKGGAPNAIFVRGAIEALPEEILRRADEVSINYPWGSLLRGLARPETHILEQVRSLAKGPGTEFRLILNYSVLSGTESAESLSLPELSEEYIETTLLPAYSSLGISIVSWNIFSGPSPIRSTWGQRLTKGSKRRSLELIGTAI